MNNINRAQEYHVISSDMDEYYHPSLHPGRLIYVVCLFF